MVFNTESVRGVWVIIKLWETMQTYMEVALRVSPPSRMTNQTPVDLHECQLQAYCFRFNNAVSLLENVAVKVQRGLCDLSSCLLMYMYSTA